MKNVLSAVLLLFVLELHACSTPVFQYALERWEPDPFILYLIDDGQHAQALVQKSNEIESYLSTVQSSPSLVVRLITDLGQAPNELLAFLDKQQTKPLPRAILQFPSSNNMPTPVWQAHLEQLDSAKLMRSPKRTELARRLASGQTAVWVLLNSGHKDKDEATKKHLQQILNDLSPQLQTDINIRLSGIDFNDSQNELDDGTLNLEIPTVRSSILTIDRTEPNEQILIKMLTQNNKELLETNNPIAFPVYGRGRALWPMTRSDLTIENIRSTMEFLCGSCSCQIKDQNPGYDIMLCVDWELLIQNRIIGQTKLPELTGPSAEIPAETKLKTTTSPQTTTEARSIFLTPILLIILVLLFIIAGTFIIITKRSEK